MCSCEQLLELRAATSDIAVVLDELGAELDKVRSPLRHLPRARPTPDTHGVLTVAQCALRDGN